MSKDNYNHEVSFLQNKIKILLRQSIDHIMEVEKTIDELNNMTANNELLTLFNTKPDGNKTTTVPVGNGPF